MLFRQGRDGVEVGALVVGDVGGVVAEEVPASLADQGEESLVAERAAVDRPAGLGGQGHPLASDLVGVLVGPPAEDGRDLMAGGGQLADEPEPGERTPAGEEDLHDASSLAQGR